MPHRILEKINLAEITSAPVTQYVTAGATVSAGYASYTDYLSTVTGLVATISGIVLSLIIIRVNLVSLKYKKLAEIDRQEQSALSRRKLELEIKRIKVSIKEGA
tara:strand:+ start:239 stop:550 length:312 start_codon:yes stop_codon:yes gene_type:complete